MVNNERLVVGSLILAVLVAGFALAANDPTAPQSITEIADYSFDESNYAPQSVEALAGNITAINLVAIGQTKSWQGYFGNITATITLDDANNNTFYNWSAAEPRGEVYASLVSSVTWSGVDCYTLDAANDTTIETYFGIATDDSDGVNETYTSTGHPTFQIGSRDVTGCPTTYIFRDDAPQTLDFVNVLLHDPAEGVDPYIYATLIENKTAGSTNDATCFNGIPCDFQILVNEDGHGTDTATTTYYFWVELN